MKRVSQDLSIDLQQWPEDGTCLSTNHLGHVKIDQQQNILKMNRFREKILTQEYIYITL